jgi:hypothetical protein
MGGKGSEVPSQRAANASLRIEKIGITNSTGRLNMGTNLPGRRDQGMSEQKGWSPNGTAKKNFVQGALAPKFREHPSKRKSNLFRNS